MANTVRQIVSEAFRELGLADYDYDIDPDEQQTALRRLRGMMALWDTLGIRLGFNFAGGLDDDSGLPDSAFETVYLNLARRMGPAFGKTLQPTMLLTARQGYETLLIAAAKPRQMQQPRTLPRGQGAKPWRSNRPYNFPPTDDPLQVSVGGDLDIL